MQDIATEALVGGEVPILFNFPPYGYKRFRCPTDGQPLENRTREYSTFGVGTYRCLGGHEWTRDSDSLWTREEEDALSRQLAEMRTTIDTAATSLYRLEQEDAHCKFAYDGEHTLCHWTRAQHATFGPASHEWQGETARLNGHAAR